MKPFFAGLTVCQCDVTAWAQTGLSLKEYYKYQKAYKKFKNNEKLKDKHLLILDKHDFKDPFINFEMIKPKYTQYRVNFLIFDDLISHQSAFKKIQKYVI